VGDVREALDADSSGVWRHGEVVLSMEGGLCHFFVWMGGRENRRGFFVAKSDQVVLPIELAPDDVLRVLLPQSANVRLADVGVVFDSLRVLWVLGQVNIESALSVLGRKSIVITSLCRKTNKKMYALRVMVCARRYAVLTRRKRYL